MTTRGQIRGPGGAAMILILILGSLLAACGDDNGETTTTEGTTTTEATTTTGATTTEATTTTAATTTTSIPLPPGAYAVEQADTCVIGSNPGDRINVRSGPGSANSLVGTLAEDATGVHTTGWAALDADREEWRQVLYEDETAWVFSAYMTPGACTVGPPAGYCLSEQACADTPNVRTGLGAAYDVIGTLPLDSVGIQGTGATTVDHQDRTWVQVRYQDGVGWVAGWLLTQEPCSPTDCPPPPMPWIITPASVGPIEIGMPISELDHLTGLNWSWSEDCAVGCLTGTAPGLSVYVFSHEGTVVDEIDVMDADVAVTADGIRVGDQRALLLATYGTRVLNTTSDGYGGNAVWIDLDANGTADMVALVPGLVGPAPITGIRLPAVLSEGCC